MNDEVSKPAMAFWIISGVGLLWNLFGLMIYYQTVTATPETLASQPGFTPEMVDAVVSTPAWATSATAIATTAGVIGCLFLLLRNSLAVPLLILSVVGAVVQDIYVFGVIDSVAIFGAQPLYIQATVLVFGLFLVWYALQQKKRGVIR